MPRLFTGLEVPDEVASTLAMMRGGLQGARWIDPDDYHVTLRFFGDVDDRTAFHLHEMLVDARPRPLRVKVDGLGAFGGDRPRAIFAAVAPTPELAELQAEHERIARRAGLPPEGRKFTPHVTLARLRSASARHVAAFLSDYGHVRPMGWEPDAFVLYSSRDSVGGGPYVVEEAYPLQRRDGPAALSARPI